MAFNIRSLRAIAPLATTDVPPASVPNLYAYVTTDALAVVQGVNYFLPAQGVLPAGSVIILEYLYGASAVVLLGVVRISTAASVTTSF